MKLFKCKNCQQLLFFENQQCIKCDHALGFVVEDMELYPLERVGDNLYTILGEQERQYKYCKNKEHDVCNWLIPANDDSDFCVACNLNNTIPNLATPAHLERWKNIEIAKHRLVYALLNMQLPVISKNDDEVNGLFFDFLADKEGEQRVLTGHANGLITINIEEADDIEREMARRSMDEPYRTLLGHFRHEVGHYYWEQIIANSSLIDEYRSVFGDEREDYGEALKKHYAQEPSNDWQNNFISNYAASHSWEDWAETWAHYLHILDTLETAHAYGLSIHPTASDDVVSLDSEIIVNPYHIKNFDLLISLWLPLTFAMNSINRSMGHADMYPFVIPAPVIEKMRFIHKACLQYRK